MIKKGYASQLIPAGLLGLTLSLNALGADCNNNGICDVDDIQEGFNEDCNLNGIPDECKFIPHRFGMRQKPYPVTNNSRAIRADFDREGGANAAKIDLSPLSIFLNKGDGTFSQPRSYPVEKCALSSVTKPLEFITCGYIEGLPIESLSHLCLPVNLFALFW
jgi:hypothetical protein